MYTDRRDKLFRANWTDASFLYGSSPPENVINAQVDDGADAPNPAGADPSGVSESVYQALRALRS
jgi:hypothetical protein